MTDEMERAIWRNINVAPTGLGTWGSMPERIAAVVTNNGGHTN